MPANSQLSIKKTKVSKDKELENKISSFQSTSYRIMSEEVASWKRANQMWKDCYNDIDTPANLYNPTLMLDIYDRIIQDVSLAQYILNIQGSTVEDRQAIRNAVSFVEDGSGLTSTIKESDKGAWSWIYLGNMVLWWGKSQEEWLKQGIPIEFKAIRPTHAFFSAGAVAIRDHNGFPICKEALLIQEYQIEEVREMFKGNKNIDQVKEGNLSFYNTQELETRRWDTKAQDKITQVGYYYDPIEKTYVILAGSDNTILETYFDEEYPFHLDGVPYIPASMFKCFPRYDKIYARGVYHKYAKLANADKRRRDLAHQFAENNVFPDKFVNASDDAFATFHNQIETAREIKRQGGDAYVQLEAGSEIQMGDLRTAPLSQEFERMKTDDYEQVTMSGIALNDISIPTSQKATNTVAMEKNKTRLANGIIRANASESVFLRRVILDYIKRYCKKNKALLPTNSKVTIVEQGKLFQATPEGITMGDVAEYITKNKVFVRSNFSAFDDVGFKLGRTNDALLYAQNTPFAQALGQEALEALGYDVTTQEIQQEQNNVKSPSNAPQTVNSQLGANAPVSIQ